MQEKEKSAGKGQKKNWFQGLQSEFKKIVWVDKATLVKQTIAVTIITVVLAVIISVFVEDLGNVLRIALRLVFYLTGVFWKE